MDQESDDVSNLTGDDFAAVLEYPGDGNELRTALIDAGFLSSDGRTVLGWEERYGAVFAFYRDRARKAASARWRRDASESDHTPEEKKKDRIGEGEGASDKHASSVLEASATAVPLKLEADVSAEAIYEAYPRKVARQDALGAIRKAMRARPPADLLDRTRRYAAAVTKWSDSDKQFVPHPATWFNRGSFDDDPSTWERNYGPSQGANHNQQKAPTSEDHAKGFFYGAFPDRPDAN